jgi:SAM-dependent MidA family methyltransferase
MPDLRAFLQQTFEKSGGAMPFENFMAMALYDPHFGYYSAGIESVGGPRGDFATSASLTSGLGKAIGRWIQSEATEREWSGTIPVIEVGAGNGDLAREVLRSFGWWKRRHLDYHIVDVSAPLREKQRSQLKSFSVTWHSRISEALEATGGRALIFSNELVDAFPAKWFTWSDIEQCWLEIFVKFDSRKGLEEVFKPLPRGFPDFAYSALQLRNLNHGQRVEIQPLYQRWLANLSEVWNEGALLTIDYGGKAEEIYERRPAGTMRGYYRQERIEGGEIYQRFGKQDLTIDVNFTDLEAWGEEFDLTNVSEESQSEFLSRFGESGDPMAGDGVGEAFRVLLQHR